MAKKMTPAKYGELATGVRLSSHEKLCAERQKHILDSIQELNKEVKCLRQDVLKGKGVVSALVFIGGCVAAITGFFKFNG